MEQWIVREAGADGMRERSLLEAVPDLEWVPPEVRFFQDWKQTSAGSQLFLRFLEERHPLTFASIYE